MKELKNKPLKESGHKQTEESVRESEEKCRLLAERAADGIWYLDRHFRTVYVNPAMQAMLGYSSKEMIGRSWYDFGDREWVERAGELETSREKGISEPHESLLIHKDGRKVLVRISTALLYDRDGGFSGAIGIVSGVTERKQVTENYREEHEWLEHILNITGTRIDVVDGDFNLHFVDKAWQKVYGAPAGRKCYEYFNGLSEPCPGCGIPHALATKEMVVTEEVLPKENNRVVEVHIIPFQNATGQWLVAEFNVDVTERKKLETERREFETRMQQTQRLESLGVLAGGIAHDFNNILMAIMGHAELAVNAISPLSPGREHFSEIMTASKRAADLCAQMLAYAGKSRIEKRSLVLGDLVEETLHLLKTSISKKAILNLNLERSLPCISGDPSQIRQILMNLVINASEAIGKRSGTIALSTGAMDCSEQYLADGYIVAPGQPGTYVYIEVSDTGCGMGKETIQRIFEPFFTTKFTGRGVGLAALLGIVKAHEGALRVYSEPGKGSTFKVLFPAIDALEDQKSAHDANINYHGSGTVLLVDDEESIRALSSAQLRHLGLEVLTAEDGRQAVNIYRERKEDIDLVLLDLTMPHMNGEEAFRELRQINPKVRVILASGYSENDISSRFAGKGLGGCLQKPYTLAKLCSLLSTLLPKAEPTTRPEESKCRNNGMQTDG